MSVPYYFFIPWNLVYGIPPPVDAGARALGTHSYAETNLNARSKAKFVVAFLLS